MTSPVMSLDFLDLNNTRYEYFTVEDGLPENGVRCMEEDSYGVLWICTSVGLVRYDGYEFETIVRDNRGNEILSRAIRNIVATDSKIYIATAKGLYTLNLHSGNIDLFLPETFREKYIYAIKLIDSTLYVGTNNGLYRVENDSIRNYAPNHDVREFWVNSSTILISSIGKGIYELTTKGSLLVNIKKVESIPKVHALDIIYNNKHYYIITHGDGLVILDNNLNLKKHIKECDSENCLGSNYLSNVKFGANGYYISNRGGLTFYNNEHIFQYNFKPSDFIDSKYISNTVQFLKESSSHYWIGLRPGGLIKLKKNNPSVQIAQSPTNSNNSNDKSVYAINKYNDAIYVGTYSGLYILHKSKKNLEPIDLNYKNTRREISRVNDLCSTHEFLYVSTSNGVYKVTDTHDVQLITSVDKNVLSFENLCSNNSLYYLSNNSLIHLNENDLIHEYEFDYLISSDNITSFYIEDRNIYIGSEEGVQLYEINIDGELDLLFAKNTEQKVMDIVKLNDDVLALTYSSIYIVHQDSIQNSKYTLPQLTEPVSIYSAQVISDSLWLLTNRGLWKLHDDGTNQQFSISHGLGDKEFNMRASYYDLQTDTLYVGGLTSVTTINVMEFVRNTWSKKNIVTKLVRANSDGVVYSESLIPQNHLDIYEGESIHLELGFANSFSRTGTDFYYQIDSLFNKSKIQLKPNERRISLVNVGTADFTINMPFADYSIDVEVIPYVWKRWWAYLIYVVLCSIGVFLFIRHYRAVQETRHNEALAQSELDSKRKQLASLSHELRTPLNSIIGILQSSTDLMSDAKYMNSSAHLLRSLIDNVLNNASMEIGNKLSINQTPTSLVKLVNDCIHIMQPYLNESRISVDTQHSNDLPELTLIDKVKVQQIILNLFKNAVRHATGATKIIVRIDTAKNQVLITVEDNGDGITEEEKDKVFDIFHKDKNRSTGFGLGLHISKSIAQAMDGDLTLDDSFKGGARFNLTLPMNEVTTESYKNQIKHEIKVFNPKSLIILEDDPLNIHALKLQLNKLEHDNYKLARNLEEFNHIYSIDTEVIILDLNFGTEVNGVELANILREKGYRGKIYILSAETDPKVISQSLSFVNDYLLKPVTLDSLRNVVFTKN